MASAKATRIRDRLAQIKDEASDLIIHVGDPNSWDIQERLVEALNLAEEAAGLGLELADLLNEKRK